MNEDPGAAAELERLAALRGYGVLDTEPERDYDDLVALAARLCAAPSALIAVVDRQRVWFKAKYGIAADELPRGRSFCADAIAQRELFEVRDAAADARYADNPLVTGGPGIRFYAAAPLISPEGHALGALCVLDRRPRELTADQRGTLEFLGRLVMTQLELRRRSREATRINGALLGILEDARRAESGMRESEALIRQSNERLQLVARATNDALWDWDMVADTIWGNAAYQALLDAGAIPIARAAQIWRRLVHPDDLPRVLTRLHEALDGDGDHWTDEYRFRRRDGAYLNVLDRGFIVRDAAGRATRMIGAVMDITERKRSEIRINHLNRVYEVLSAINQSLVRAKDRQEMLEASCRIAVESGGFGLAWIGLREGGVDPSPFRIQAFAADAPMTREFLEGIVHSAPANHCVFTLEALADGRHRICYDIASDPRARPWREDVLVLGYRSMASFPLLQDEGVVGVLNLYAKEVDFFDAAEVRLLDELAADISFGLTVDARERTRRQVEADLRASEERFREVVENIHEVFWVSDPKDRRVLYLSPLFEQVWGMPVAAVLARSAAWMEVIHPDDLPRVRHALEVDQVRGDYDETYRIVRSDGSIRWIRDRAYPIRGAGGEVLRMVGTAEDITAQRQLEHELRQAQKMEAIGLLAGGVAHDFNNILAAIMMQAEIAGAVPGVPEEALDLLEELKTSASRAASLTRQLLAFGRRQVMQPRVLDLNEIVNHLSTMLQRVLGEDVQLTLDLAPGPLMTFADSGMIGQLLMNLVINARDAMPKGGLLRIETRSRDLSPAEARLIPEITAGRHVCLRVADTGCGIAPEIQAHIFEPFFTTKEPGKGTGLGLPTVFGIVKQHRGAIRLDSEPGRGTTFEVLLRAAEGAEASAAAEPAAAPAPAKGTETVLVVEDEPSVRLLTRMVLERQGYQVLEAAHGAEAIEVWRRHGGRIALLFTDIVMPEGMSGRELADKLREHDPALKVIFTSGYSAEIAGREFSLQPGQNFVQKPTRPQAIVEAVRRCLDG